MASPDASGSGFAVRARPAGLDFIAQAIRDKVPTHFDIPPIEGELVTVSNAAADLSFRSLTLTPQAGRLDLHAELDLHAVAFVDAGFTDCDLDVEATPLQLDLGLVIGTAPAGGIEVSMVDVEIGLTPEAFDLDFQHCVVGNLVEAVLNAVEGWALDKARDLIEDLAEDELLPRIRDAVESLGSLTLERDGFVLQGGVRGLEVAAGRGLTIDADGEIRWTGPVHPDIIDQGPPAWQPTVGPALPPDYGPGGFALAASDDRVTFAIYQAWRAGMLHQILSGASPSLVLDGEGLGQKLGLPGGTTVDIAIDVTRTPRVGFGRDVDLDGIRVYLDGLRLTATITAPSAPPSAIDIDVAGVLRATLGIDPQVGALRIEPTRLDITSLQIAAGSQLLEVDTVRLREFVAAVAVPLLADKLAGIPIAPALRPMDDLFMVLRDVSTQTGWARAALDLYRPDPNDHSAPDTLLVDPPRIVSPAHALFPVSGSDDTTPPELLRYVVKVDGVVVGDEADFMTAVRVSAADGNHLLEVAAVDLNGNTDATQVVHSFVVDGVPPVLTVTDPPADILGDEQPHVRWTASDDRTPTERIEGRWELRHVAEGGALGEVVAGAEFTAGLTELDLPELTGDSLYVLEIVIRDEAGNVTSSEHALVVEPGSSGGCSAGGSEAGMWALLVAAAVLILLRRRAGLGLLMAAALAPATAHAQGVGTAFSGPTDGDGAAAFWNPAAMSRGLGSQVDLGSGLSFIRVDYQPMDSDTGSHTFVPKPEPTLGAFTDLGTRRWRAGFTIGVPQMDGAKWGRDDGAGDVTRWYAVEARSYNVTITPAVAFAPRPWISVGAGVDIVRARIECEMDKDMGKQLNLTAGSPYPDSPFPYADPDLAAPLDLDATGWGVGAVAGLMLRPHHRVTIGASVHSAVTARARGGVHVTYPEAMEAFVAEAAPAAELPPLEGRLAVDTTQPLMAFAAVAVAPADRWELRADYRFIDRSDASDLHFDIEEATSEDVRDTMVVRGYRDRHSLGLRAEHAFLEGRGVAALRTRWEPNSVPETTAAPNNIDFDKLELGAGLRFWINRRAAVIANYSHYILRERTVADSLHQPLAERELDAFNHPSPTGTYSAAADYVAFVLSVVM